MRDAVSAALMYLGGFAIVTGVVGAAIGPETPRVEWWFWTLLAGLVSFAAGAMLDRRPTPWD